MIRVFHGDDDFGISQAVGRLRDGLGADGLAESNTIVFEGRDFVPGAVVAAARTVPFLAPSRLVIVRGLLRRLDTTARTRRGGDDTAPMRADGWDTFGEELNGLPETTELVFVDVFPPGTGERRLRPNGAALRALAPAGDTDVREFAAPRGRAVQDWIREQVAAENARASGPAIARLADLIGPNLRLLDQEIRKLALYVGDRPIEPADVDLQVAPAREASIFAAVDAIVERRPGIAMRSLYRLLDGGASVQYILVMLARQVRMLLLAKHLRGKGVDDAEIGSRIGLRAGFALRKTLEQTGRFTPDYLARAHRDLLDAELETRSGALDQRLVLEMLVARLAGLR